MQELSEHLVLDDLLDWIIISTGKGHAGATHHIHGRRSLAHPQEPLTHLYNLYM